MADSSTYSSGAMPIVAEFNGTPVSIIERDGQRWLTAEQVGICLGYDTANARKGVNKLHERHHDEFTDSETCVVKLTTGSRGEQNTRIFSATGCIKLGFFANTAKAKAFRTWAADVLTGKQSLALVAEQATTELWGRLLAAHEQLSQRDEKIINLLQAQQQDLRGQVAKLTQQVERLSGKVITTQTQLVKAQTYTIDLVAGRMSGAEASSVIIDMERRGESRERIREVTGRTYNNIRQAIHKARLRGDLPLATQTPAQPQQSALDLEGVAHA